MGFVVLVFLVLCLVAAAPFGYGLSRFLLGRMPAPGLPAEYARYRPDRHPAVHTAEDLVAATYRDLADLYPDPTFRP